MLNSAGDGAKLSSHEEERMRNIERNHAQMISLGFFGVPKVLTDESEPYSLGAPDVIPGDEPEVEASTTHCNIFSFCHQIYSAEDALRHMADVVLERDDAVRSISGFLDKVLGCVVDL
jgi:hypothetical protein